jgi:hypothetical protein
VKKIPSLFQRNYETDRRIRDEVVVGCEWVLAGEGVATVKWDGTACLVRDGVLYKRYDAKKGKTPPEGFEPAEAAPDALTGHWPGWLPVSDSAEDKWHREAWEREPARGLRDGTYELIGPKIQGNPHGLSVHQLIQHGNIQIEPCPRTFAALREHLSCQLVYEGIVFHHPDGRMCKVKRRDYGLPWPVRLEARE